MGKPRIALTLWDRTTGNEHCTIQGYNDYISAVSITPDGQKAFSGSSEKTCILWDLNSGKMLKALKGI